MFVVSSGPEGGVCEAADPCVRPGAAEPDPECSVSATGQNLHRSRLTGRKSPCLKFTPTVLQVLLAA